MIWIGCRKYSTEQCRVFPDNGGWLDQTAEFLYVMDMIDTIYEEEKAGIELYEKLRRGESP